MSWHGFYVPVLPRQPVYAQGSQSPCPHACAAIVSADLDVRRLSLQTDLHSCHAIVAVVNKITIEVASPGRPSPRRPTAGAVARMLSCYVRQELQGCPVGAALMLPPEATAQCVHALAARVLHALPCIHGFFLRIMWKLTCSGDRIPGNSLNIRHY